MYGLQNKFKLTPIHSSISFPLFLFLVPHSTVAVGGRNIIAQSTLPVQQREAEVEHATILKAQNSQLESLKVMRDLSKASVLFTL